MTRVAAIQMCSTHTVDQNLQTAERLLTQAREEGAMFAVLPEYFALMPRHAEERRNIAEHFGDGPIQQRLSDIARRLCMWIAGGTIPLRVPGEERPTNSLLVFNATGRTVARYDKIHLFDTNPPGAQRRYCESDNIVRGHQPVVVDSPFGRLGLSICYDLRFPELFRRLSAQGAQILLAPAAFTAVTGRAHWEVLLRARAVENLCHVIAAGQYGRHVDGSETWGDSMIVTHWGEVLARRAEGEGVVIADLDLPAQRETRCRFPALDHRVLREERST